MSSDRVRIIPLGGVAEVGKNMTVIGYGDDLLIIDVGVGFPEEEMLGIDLVIPDISYLAGKRDRIRGILITHGHEDHIGALPYLLPEINAPIYATALSRGLIEVKLRENGMLGQADLRTVDPGDVVELGPFTVEFFQVCHSIPASVGLAIDTPAGLIVHTSDFKFDQTPVDGRATDFAKLAELGGKNVLVLLSDCVHVESPGFTPSEQVVGEAFDRIFRQAQGRIIVATFASLISRVQQVIDTAFRYGRKVAVVGRSLENNIPMARELGYLKVPEDTLVSLNEINKLPYHDTVLIVTGSQGEPTAVLGRMANQDYRQVRIVQGDTVIVSANPIPGNESSVARIIDNLLQQGADVIYGAVDTVHVSGHASQEELKLMLNLLRPRYLVPFHGEYRHMVLYRKLATSVGIPEENIILSDAGSVMEFEDNFGKVVGKVPAGYVFVDGVTVGDVGSIVVRDRQLLARDGILIAVVTIDRQTGHLVAGPDIVSRTFSLVREADELIESTKEKVREALTNGREAPAEWSFLHHKIKDVVSEFLYSKTRRRPLVLPVVMEV
ncbi:MAG: ribonuclease J [Chloroflexi bacterium]|nr:ribonuclease J [Chloroflexota bacterium]